MHCASIMLKDENIINYARRLTEYIRSSDWKGYDPYDALNSVYLKKIQNKWLRIATIQFLRRFPLNLRPLLKIDKGHNPKAIALFIRSLVKLSSLLKTNDYKDDIKRLIALALSLRSKTSNDNVMAWGYNFGWQSRVFYCDSFSPNIQSTIMNAHAFFELQESQLFKEDQLMNFRDICIKANQYMLNELILKEDSSRAILAYIPNDNAISFNVQAQAAWSLLRAFSLTGVDRFRELACKLIRFVESKQRSDGSWFYGEADCQKFIDNFHTGFILESLYECKKICGDYVSDDVIRRGYQFYLNNFFTGNGIVKYFAGSTYPIDAHAIAQSIISLCKLADYNPSSGEILESSLDWTLTNFLDDEAYFYYQKWLLFTNKIPYVRWTQAWMLFALITLLEAKREVT